MVLGIPLLLLASMVLSQCQVRQEWRQLTPQAQRNFIEAVKKLKERGEGSPNDPATWNQNKFSKTHIQFYENNHGKDAFFPWHRHFIQGYENALKSIDPSIVLPYWDCKTQ